MGLGDPGGHRLTRQRTPCGSGGSGWLGGSLGVICGSLGVSGWGRGRAGFGEIIFLFLGILLCFLGGEFFEFFLFLGDVFGDFLRRFVWFWGGFFLIFGDFFFFFTSAAVCGHVPPWLRDPSSGC